MDNHIGCEDDLESGPAQVIIRVPASTCAVDCKWHMGNLCCSVLHSTLAMSAVYAELLVALWESMRVNAIWQVKGKRKEALRNPEIVPDIDNEEA